MDIYSFINKKLKSLDNDREASANIGQLTSREYRLYTKILNAVGKKKSSLREEAHNRGLLLMLNCSELQAFDEQYTAYRMADLPRRKSAVIKIFNILYEEYVTKNPLNVGD